MYPEDCLQSVIKPAEWWVENRDATICRGSLLFAFVPHIDQVPYTVAPVGRQEAERHDSAVLRVEPLRIKQPRRRTDLPVAAMSLNSGELWVAYRAKKRPCLVMGSDTPIVNKTLTRGMPNLSTAQTVLVAPFYGADQDGTRAGYKPEFVERVRHCEYPQFFWDCLPIPGPQESILRLDHLQPVGTHHNSYELSEWKLSDEALIVLDELATWLIWGGVPEDSLIALYRSEIESTFTP